MLKFNDYIKEAKELSPKQKKIAAIAGDKDKIDADDLAALRAGKKPVDECDYGKMKKEELVGKQYKLDKNHNGKIDADDFKKLRKEEAEQIDELSPATLKSYKKGITRDLDRAADAYPHGTGDDKEDHKLNKRVAGDELASKKLKAKGVNPYSEEVEQIDELSKKTLGSYVKKASHDARMMGQIAGDFENRSDKARKQSKRDSNYRLSRKYLEKAWKRDTGIGKAVDKLTKEEVELDEGRMKDIYTSMMHHADKKGYSSHKEFKPADYDAVGKEHGISGADLAVIAGHKTAQQADTHFKKPVEPGKGMDRAKALAQRGMQSLSKEEVERIEEKLTQLDELSKKTLGSYAQKAQRDSNERKDDWNHDDHAPYEDDDDNETEKGTDARKIHNRDTGVKRAIKKLSKEEVEQIDELSKKTLGSYVKKASGDLASSIHYERDAEEDNDSDAAGAFAHRAGKRLDGLNRAGKKIAKEEVSQEMSPYVKGTLAVMDEGKIDDLRDAQKLRQASQSAYDKNYKPDTSHPHIQVVKGTAYGGENQKDDEGDEKPDETKEKKGRGRPAGSKSGARQKGGGHEDGGIPVHNLNLPKSYK